MEMDRVRLPDLETVTEIPPSSSSGDDDGVPIVAVAMAEGLNSVGITTVSDTSAIVSVRSLPAESDAGATSAVTEETTDNNRGRRDNDTVNVPEDNGAEPMLSNYTAEGERATSSDVVISASSDLESIEPEEAMAFNLQALDESVKLVIRVLYDRFDRLLLLALSCFLMGLSTGFVPYCESFPLMLIMRFLAGLGCGGLDTGGNADIVAIWGAEGRPFIQAWHACFGFGGIIAPLVTEPFLSKKFEVISKLNVTGANTTETSTVYGKTSIHYSYLISMFVICSGGIPFLMIFVRNKCSKKTRDMVAPRLNQKRPDKLSLWLKAFLCILLSLLSLVYCAVEDTFSGFLATFCVDYLKWDKGISSFATSLHWVGFSIGRFMGIFLVVFFRPVQLMCSYLIFLILAFIAFTVCSVTLTEIGVWIFIPFAGFSMSVIFPCIFMWTEESILKVTGKISSMLLVAASSGLLINPLIVGYLMQNISPVAFVFVLLTECFLCFGTFLLIFLLVKKFIKNPPSSADTEIVVSPSTEMQPFTANSD
ncbi:sodium-dependent glucose transporter 1B-like [Dreissena polymorpha]|uniref:sodium-dependent glucose transporter 1B-like n=1 Tax=Dreissena polymorpha TaxID=45954 RepID=UPI0022643538|nr:sodium-dependent glucose transporter 1B-like [Dreissena polymorpha]